MANEVEAHAGGITLVPVTFGIKRWNPPNGGRRRAHNYATTVFAEVNSVLSDCERKVRALSLPSTDPSQRWIQPRNLISYFSVVNRSREKLELALKRAELEWQKLMIDEQQRFGERRRNRAISMCPWDDVRAAFAILSNAVSCETDILFEVLGEFSLSFSPKPVPTEIDAFDWADRLRREMEKPVAERQIPPWPFEAGKSAV